MKRQVRKYIWGEDAEASGPRNYFRESLMITSLKKCVTSGKVLDAGCGTGSLTIRLAGNHYNLCALDNSFLSLRHLNEKVRAHSLQGKVEVKHGSVLKLPFKNNYFNGIVCGEVLEHIKMDRKVIQEFYRVMKKGGVSVVTVPAHSEEWDITDDISGHKRRYTKEELIKKFSRVGFSIVKCEYVGFPLNNVWHKYIFLPFLLHRVKQRKNRAVGLSLVEKLKNSIVVQRLSSLLFYFDFLFSSTNKGNILLLVAQKI